MRQLSINSRHWLARLLILLGGVLVMCGSISYFAWPLKQIAIAGGLNRVVIQHQMIYVLGRQDSKVRVYRQDGTLADYYEFSNNGVVTLMRDVQDFCIGPDGSCYALAYVMPEKISCIIRYDAQHGSFRLIRLTKEIYAYRLDMDAQGNYYVLGHDASVGEALMLHRGVMRSNRISLVHKFGSDGSYLRSVLEVAAPANTDEYRVLLSSIAERNNFVALANGSVCYLARNVGDPKDRKVYCVDSGGITSESVPNMQQGQRLMGLHKSGQELLIELSGSKAVSPTMLVKQDGTVVGRIPTPGRILATENGIVATVIQGQAGSEIAFSSIQ
jgi:hypothetical protein